MKQLEPILVRANVAFRLRELRKNIELLRSNPDRTPEDLLFAEELQLLHDDMKRQFIFLIHEHKDSFVRHL